MEPSDFKTALDAIDSINQAKTLSEVHAHIEKSLSSLGYEHSIFALSPSPHRLTFDKLVVYQHWPQNWFEQYRYSNFHAHDPVAKYVRTQLDPFDWDIVPPTEDPVSKQLMEISAFDFGMQRGHCIPIHDSFGYRGAISLAGLRDHKKQNSAADLISIFAFNRMNRFQLQARTTRLTAREREVVSWAAAGKTAWDTGSILHVSEKTIEKHMAAAMRKFDSYSKAQVVAECLRAGEITL